MSRRWFRRTKTLFFAVLGALAFAALWGCDETPCVDCGCCPPHSPYSTPTAPESLITNLQVSYRRREIQEYAKILAPEFIFRFQPIDATELETLVWSHDHDSTGTANLFKAPEVSDIRIELLHGPAEPASEPGMPPGARKIRILQTDLQVDVDLVTLLVTDQQDMFFRRGFADAGEDTTHWFLFEWRDLPSLTQLELEPFAVSNGTTWGRLKSLYRN